MALMFLVFKIKGEVIIWVLREHVRPKLFHLDFFKMFLNLLPLKYTAFLIKKKVSKREREMFLRPLVMHLSFKTRFRHYSDKNKNLIRKERIKMGETNFFFKE